MSNNLVAMASKARTNAVGSNSDNYIKKHNFVRL